MFLFLLLLISFKKALPQLVEPQPSTSQLISSLDNRDNNPVPPYYGGEEIGCYMPHRGDFSVVSLSQYITIGEYIGTYYPSHVTLRETLRE